MNFILFDTVSDLDYIKWTLLALTKRARRKNLQRILRTSLKHVKSIGNMIRRCRFMPRANWPKSLEPIKLLPPHYLWLLPLSPLFNDINLIFKSCFIEIATLLLMFSNLLKAVSDFCWFKKLWMKMMGKCGTKRFSSEFLRKIIFLYIFQYHLHRLYLMLTWTNCIALADHM